MTSIASKHATGQQKQPTKTSSEHEAREVAEAAREKEWTAPSFGRGLFEGKLYLDLIHPFPSVPAEELERIVVRSAAILDVDIEQRGATEISKRSRGTPRVAHRLLRRVRDYAQVKADGVITHKVAEAALRRLKVDEYGLDDMDVRVLKTIIDKFDGRPVGLNTLAMAVGEDAGTLEEVYEPFLVQQGFLNRTARGRMATPAAYRHLGIALPTAACEQSTMFEE